MSFRTEFKIIIHYNQYFNFLEWLSKNKFKKIHKSRKIFSTYFDNNDLEMFRDSEEGIIPRKKIRVRSYDKITHDKNSNFEIKITSLEGRYKKIINKTVLKNYFDPIYGHTYPVINVFYDRKYFIKDNIRLTIDSKLGFSNIENTNSYDLFDKYIVELKSKKRLDDLNILEKFNVTNSRFSKYCEAIKLNYNFT